MELHTRLTTLPTTLLAEDILIRIIHIKEGVFNTTASGWMDSCWMLATIFTLSDTTPNRIDHFTILLLPITRSAIATFVRSSGRPFLIECLATQHKLTA